MLNRKSKLAVLIFSVLLLTIAKYLIDRNMGDPFQVPQLTAYATIPVVGGLIALSFCSLLGTFAVAGDSTTSSLLRRVSVDPARNFIIGFLIVAYLYLVRSPLTSTVLFLPYIEWVAVTFAVYVFYTLARLSKKEFYFSSEGSGWKRHIQEVRRETGRDLIRVTSVMEQFVDHGVKEPLLVYLTLHLQRLGETEEDILKTLSPLVDYHYAPRRRLYSMVFPWKKRQMAVENRKEREVLLNTLIEEDGRL